jgi:pSer/pThr/pTyr-binding forkhead associated (FHA) protein
MLSAKLVVVGGDAKRREVNLKLPTIIGRGREGVSLTLPHKLVSRKHTEIFEQDGGLFVRDLGSLNGTFVNNQRIEGDQPLKPNELLTLGNVTFRAVYEPNGTNGIKPLNLSDSPAATSASGPEPVFEEVAASQMAASQMAVSASPNVMDDEAAEQSPSSKTDNSLLQAAAAEAALQTAAPEADSSDIFSGNEIEGLTPEKSISVSALGDLPSVEKASFKAEELELGIEAQVNRIVESVNIELDEPPKAPESDNSKLGSFLKKLPR